MRFGVVFPNESSFYQKMGAEIFENYPQVQKMYKKLAKKAGVDLKRSLIYDQLEADWNETNRALAVLLTSVAFYQNWAQCHNVKPNAFYGSGVGILSAYVCAGTLPISKAVSMIRRKKMPLFTHLSGKVSSSVSFDETNLIAKHTERPSNEVESILRFAQDLDCVIEIGPNCIFTPLLRNAAAEGKCLFVHLDDPNDNAIVLENFEYQKHFNHLYAARRTLGIAAATQNYGEDVDLIVSAYAEIKQRVDDALKKQYMKQPFTFGQTELEFCIDQLKTILRLKKTPKEEVISRVLALENETALPLRSYFTEWFGGASNA